MLECEPRPNEFRVASGPGSLVVLGNGIVGAANAAAARGFALPLDRFTGADLRRLSFEAVDADGRRLRAGRCPLRRAFATALGVGDVVVGIRVATTTTWWSVSCRPLVDAAGAVTAVACTLVPTVGADDRSDAPDLEELARLAGLTLPDVVSLPPSPWALRV